MVYLCSSFYSLSICNYLFVLLLLIIVVVVVVVEITGLNIRIIIKQSDHVNVILLF